MTALLETSRPNPASARSFAGPADPARESVAAGVRSVESAGRVLGAIAIMSVTAHFLVVGLVGFGVGGDTSPTPKRAPEIPPVAVEENVELQPALPEDPASAPQSLPDDSPPVPTAPVAADLDLPPLPALAQIAAVPASVPVAFAIPVKGPVRLTNDPTRASGAIGGRGGPVSIDADGRLGKNLVLPPLHYPDAALQRRIAGSVDIEFHVASGSGAIAEARVRRSSGFSELDFAALQNLRSGRWVGSPGYYVKNYSFVLN